MKKDLLTILKHTEKLEDGCLVWTKCLNTDGYPRALIDGNANAKVHRLVYELHSGKSVVGKVVRHKCDNPRCINPEHLEEGTTKQNVQDRVVRDRTQGLKRKDVNTIKQLYHSKTYSAKELSKMFGCSLGTIYYSLNHRK